ncbi:protein of unknown function DUF4378 [Dillenia turbinata]|uniref:DUF4378 domain-containing protein n=1 Tax=Dillenia turbinata TaxID=194707 RepID=A0AAN8W3U1_9MAGN
MASSTSKPTLVKLCELLQEKQEPFVLDVFLLERAYMTKNFNSNACLKRSASCSLDSRKKGLLSCSKKLRSMLRKLVFMSESSRMKNSNFSGGEELTDANKTSTSSQEGREFDRFSSASKSTEFNSCCENEIEEMPTSLPKDCNSLSQDTQTCNMEEHKAAADRKLEWNCMEEGSKQHSPVSVLQEITSCEDSPIQNRTHQHTETRQQENASTSSSSFPKKITEDSIFSASLWQLIFHSPAEKPYCIGLVQLQELLGYDPSAQYFMSKKVLQQTKQLLFDYVREVIQTHQRKKRQQHRHMGKFLGSEELGMLICNNIRAWANQSGDKTNIDHLLNLDFSALAEEQNDFEPRLQEIGIDIGDAILEEIKNEVVLDMISLLSNNCTLT